MKRIKKRCKAPWFKCFSLLVFSFFVCSQYAFADLISSMDQLQSNIKLICQPLAIIFLIVAGWQKSMGNSQLFILALVGTVVMFAATQIVNFISSAFGG